MQQPKLSRARVASDRVLEKRASHLRGHALAPLTGFAEIDVFAGPTR